MATASVSLKVAQLFSVVGKVAVVTGGGRGIGEMIARTLVENGAKVYITSRSAAACEKTAQKLTQTGPGECVALAQDLSSAAGVQAFADALAARESKLDILVNNSGIAWGRDFDSFEEEAFDSVFALNVKSVFLLTRALRPLLEKEATAESPSRVINIGSVAGVMPQPVPTWSYDPSKAAVHMLTKKLANELAPYCTVNAIAPGFVPSRMSKGLLKYAGADAIKAAVPCERLGMDADMGGAAIYLASPAGAWVTGHILVVDGGTTCKPMNMVSNL